MTKTKHKILSVFLSLCMIISCMVGMSVTAYATPEETLLTTITPTNKSTYTETTSGVVTVTHDNSDFISEDGWHWTSAGSVSVAAAEGYTITSCKFTCNYSQTVIVSETPFKIDFDAAGHYYVGTAIYNCVKSIEVYGYASTPSTPAAQQWTNGNVTATLDGTKLTVEKTENATNGNMGTSWTKVGSAAVWSSIRGTITEVEIKDGVTSIGNSAFVYCNKLASVTIPSSVTSIDISSFFGCSALTSVTIPSSVTSIGNAAFYYCTALTSVTIPNSVTSIGENTFNNCSNLATVTFERVSETDATAGKTLAIGSSAFNGTKSGATVAYGTGDTVLYDNDTQITTETLLTAIENKTLTWKAASSTPAYQWTNGNVTATLSGTKLTVEKTAGAADGTMGTSWTKVGSAPTWSTIKETITEVEIKDGVTSIGANAFNGCSNLTSVTFPSGLTSIGDAAFANCSALTSVTFPSSLNSIGQRAFHVCTVLASVTFTPGQEGGGLTIGDSAFDDIPSTTKVTYGTGNTVLYDDTTEITTDTLLTAIQRKSLTWKAASSDIAWTNGNVIGILDGTKLTVAKKDGAQNGDMGNEWTAVTEGGATWDSKKATITEVEIQDGVTSIGNNAFNICPALESITIPDSVTSIGEGAFSWCTALTSVTIPSSVTSIGNSAFAGCTVLTSVTIPNGVTSISNSAFQSCDALTSVSIPDSVTSIGDSAFNSCTSLTSVTIPSKVARIGDFAFRSCTSLTRVTIPGSVTRIGDNAFIWCGNLATVTFEPRSTEDIESNATLTICENAFFDTVEGAKVAYGTGDTVLYDNNTPITTETLLTGIQNKTLTWKEPTYNITFDNGGTAKVDGTVVTSAAEGATVTIVADEPAPGTEFNGWTTTTEGVEFADADLAETTFRMPASDVEITASYQNIAYKITMRNGGTAYVDGEPATTAEAGTVVTIKAKSSVSTPARFNGWTTTTEGVEFADADSVETTFVMPISDVTITASFEGVTPYVPSYSPSNTSTTTTTTANAPAETMTFEGEETISHTNLLSWSSVSGASSYLISVKTDGKFVPLAATTKTNIDVVHAYNGKYYVSEGGRYTAYTYKDGKFVKGGTITAAQADKLVKANNVTDTYMLQYTKNGKLSSDKTAPTVSVKVYYKPAVKASSKDGKVVLKWKKVVGAEKYRIYKYEGGKLVKVADTTANAVRISKVTAGKTYKYAVKAFVDGKWTKVTSKDIVSVKVK